MEVVSKAYQSFRFWLSEQLILHKLYSPLGFALMAIIGMLLAYLIASTPISFGIALFALIVGIPVFILSMTDLVFGLGLILFIAVFMGLPTKYVNLPFGTTLDLLMFILFFGLLVQQIKDRNFGWAKSPISILVLLWVGYNLAQAFNPTTESRMAWLFTVRSMAGLILLYFIACFAFKKLKHIISILKFILFLALISALYGLKQEFFGFTQQELVWLYADAHRLELIFQWSRLRIFSFFSDPTNYGIYMSYIGTFCLILAIGPYKTSRKIILVASALCMFTAMVYAGSRTPFVLIPAGLVFFVVLTLRKKHIIGLVVFFTLGSLFVLKSTSNAVLFRVQSAFDMSKSDDTINVRLNNQTKIQPFIHSHPFGAGLGSTGMWGQRFTPDSKLAKFAHDSGFVRIAVELGWIGLLIYAALLFTIIRVSIYYYVRVTDPKVKNIYLGLTVVVFQLILANYPQEAIVALPTSITFYIMVAMIVRLQTFDKPIDEGPFRRLELPDGDPRNINDISKGLKRHKS